MLYRSRILRKSASIRKMVRETQLMPQDFIVPLFIIEGSGVREAISSMPGYYRRSLDLQLIEINQLQKLGIRSILLFAKCPDPLKDNEGKEAINPQGLMQRSIRTIKESFPEMVVMSDVALDPYSIFGHDGIVKDEQILNDQSVHVLVQMSLSHAEAGADLVAPSDMMDGRVRAIRSGLEKAGFTNTGIMSYSAKYASSFYGPFREAMDSAPGFGDKNTYQMDPANRREALKEILYDVEEGTDMVMVKPALPYLDIIREAKNVVKVPVSAYQVSGEYAMIKAAAQAGWIDEKEAMMESLISIKRAGADLIATYFAKDAIEVMVKGH